MLQLSKLFIMMIWLQLLTSPAREFFKLGINSNNLTFSYPTFKLSLVPNIFVSKHHQEFRQLCSWFLMIHWIEIQCTFCMIHTICCVHNLYDLLWITMHNVYDLLCSQFLWFMWIIIHNVYDLFCSQAVWSDVFTIGMICCGCNV